MAEIVCPLHEAAQVTPHFPALTDGDERMNYSELNQQVLRVQAGLAARGITAGDRVGLLMPVNAGYIAALVALWRLQAVACPLNTAAPVALTAQQAEALQLKGIICEELSAEIPVAELFLAELLIAEAAAPTDEPPRYDLSHAATILYTSGSGFAPKAAVHSVQAHYYSALGSNRNLRLKPHDIWLLSLPLYHVGGLAIIWRCLLGGACIGLPYSGMRLPDLLMLMKASHASLVSAQLRELLQHDEVEDIAESLSAVLVGGGPQELSLLKQAVMAGIPVLPTYGCTEMASQITTMPPHAFIRKPETSGKVLSYRLLEISGEGEILVQGETLFSGYVQGDEIEPAVDAEGWFHTGDLGTLDEEGFLTVTGRKDRMFVSGGENIQPEEIEAELAAQPGIIRAAVVPADDEKFGQRPVAYVEGEYEEEALAAALAERLPKYKIPVAFRPMPAEAVEGMKINYTRLQGSGNEPRTD